MDGGRTNVGVYYGYGLLSPSGVNNFITAQGGSPAENTLSNFMYFGATIGHMITPRIELIGEYTQESASNPVNNSIGTSSGVQLNMNAFFAGLNYYLVDHGNIKFSVGAEAGYPTTAHATVIQGSYSYYDSTFAPIFKTMATVDFMLGSRFSIFVSGGYEYCMLNALSNGANILQQSNGSNVNFDMSGMRVQAGLSFLF
jgi:hypothetical protein